MSIPYPLSSSEFQPGEKRLERKSTSEDSSDFSLGPRANKKGGVGAAQGGAQPPGAPDVAKVEAFQLQNQQPNTTNMAVPSVLPADSVDSFEQLPLDHVPSVPPSIPAAEPTPPPSDPPSKPEGGPTPPVASAASPNPVSEPKEEEESLAKEPEAAQPVSEPPAREVSEEGERPEVRGKAKSEDSSESDSGQDDDSKSDASSNQKIKRASTRLVVF